MLCFVPQMQDLFIQSLTGLAFSLSHQLVGKSYQVPGKLKDVVVVIKQGELNQASTYILIMKKRMNEFMHYVTNVDIWLWITWLCKWLDDF